MHSSRLIRICYQLTNYHPLRMSLSKCHTMHSLINLQVIPALEVALLMQIESSFIWTKVFLCALV
ncbi:hypothetical protein NTG1052_150013 [Candidatus Nitrotoga sp. 1052]|nr:hypothetical protein NTG1052_150013 [Candidatus Nitrotoga sp. 1052]